MKVKVTIKDVDNQPVVKCRVRVAGRPESNELEGHTYDTDLPDGTNRVEITVLPALRDYFNIELVEIDITGMTWSNPTCKVYMSQANELTVEFLLSQLRLAPVDYMLSEEIRGRKRVPRGILLNHPTYTAIDPNYMALFYNGKRDWYAPKIINHVRSRLLGTPKAEAWDRLQYDTEIVDPHLNGHFRWLEYGGRQSKYLIAIWLPKPYFESTRAPLDFIVFFTPHTRKSPYTLLDGGHEYPYGLNKEKDVFQPYAGLGPGYMFGDGRNLCHELMAVEKKAILVIPMCKYGDWGPFALEKGVGIHRMLMEIAHYLHRTGLLFNTRPNIVQKGKRALLKPEEGNVFMEKHGPIPSITKVITAGFSTNGVIDELFTGQKAQWPNITTKDPKIGSESIPATFKTRDSNSFRPLWTEIWDLDLGGDTEKTESRLREWWRANPSVRRYRMYHTSLTATRWRPRLAESWAMRDKNRKYEWIPNMLPKGAVDPYNGQAEEIHQVIDPKNDAWSLVYFSNTYLVSTKAPGFPEFPSKKGEVHNKIILPIAFGHAALSSSLEPLK